MGWSLPYTLGVLGGWKMAAVYCQAVLCHGQSIGLDGAPAEAVDAEARHLAAKPLAQLATRKVEKKAVEVAAPAVVKPKAASAPPTETPDMGHGRHVVGHAPGAFPKACRAGGHLAIIGFARTKISRNVRTTRVAAFGRNPFGRTEESIGEPLRTVHSSASRDLPGHGGHSVRRNCRLSVPAGRFLAADRLPDHSSDGHPGRRERGNHGGFRCHAARASVLADSRHNPDDLVEHARRSAGRDPVRSQS